MRKKLIINYDSDIDIKEALEKVGRVIESGKISENSKGRNFYCFLTTFLSKSCESEIAVSTNVAVSETTDSFTVYQNEIETPKAHPDFYHGLRKITWSEMEVIIDTRKPLGKFYRVSHDNITVVVDNSTGDAWTEESRNHEKIITWLKGNHGTWHDYDSENK